MTFYLGFKNSLGFVQSYCLIFFTVLQQNMWKKGAERIIFAAG